MRVNGDMCTSTVGKVDDGNPLLPDCGHVSIYCLNFLLGDSVLSLKQII